MIHPKIEHLEDSSNYLYLCLIEYKDKKYLTIIENVIDDEIIAYVIDNLQNEGINQDWFMNIANRWFYSSSTRYPLSFEFAKLGYGNVIKRIQKIFNINATTRIIGKLFKYDVTTKPKIKKRKIILNNEFESIKLRVDNQISV